MKLAVNYSYPLMDLIRDELVRVDLIKCPDWDGMLKDAEPYGPITIHFDLNVGLGNTFKVDFSRIKNLQAQTGTPLINTHLVAPQGFNGVHFGDVKRINTLWREEIQWMIDHFSVESVALEHFPFTEATPHIRLAAMSDVFSQVILDTNCMLLLDLAHARITANTLKIDTKDYIQSMPLDRLVELHITGIKLHEGILTDHFELQDEDWDILSWALKEIEAGNWRKPQIVAFEYGGVGKTFIWRTNGDVLKNQVPRLYDMVHNCD